MKIRYCSKPTVLHRISDPQNFINCVCNMIKLKIDTTAIIKFTKLDFKELQTIKTVIINNNR